MPTFGTATTVQDQGRGTAYHTSNAEEVIGDGGLKTVLAGGRINVLSGGDIKVETGEE